MILDSQIEWIGTNFINIRVLPYHLHLTFIIAWRHNLRTRNRSCLGIDLSKPS